jgi:Fic family protein
MRLTYKRIMSKLFLMNSLAESLHLDYWLTPDAEEQLRTWAAAMATEPPLHPIRWHMYLQHYLRSATVTASTQIEGNPLSLAQVDALLQGEAVDAPLRARREVINYNAALSTATSLALTPSFEWSQAVLRMLNHEILRGDPDDRQGRYREEPVTVAGFYYPPDHRLVDGLMASLVEWLGQAQDPPLVRVALLHLNLVAIHPWVNGNGRTARVASSLELMRHGVSAPELVSVEPYLREHQDEYFDRLRTTLGPSYAPDRHPATEWVNYYVGVSVGRLAFETRMEDAWPNDLGCLHDAMQNAGLPLAWVPVLLMAAIAPLRTRIVADQMDRSMPTARAMLARMEREGWLIHRGRTRGASYGPGPRLCALTLRTPELVQDYVRGHTLGLVP